MADAELNFQRCLFLTEFTYMYFADFLAFYASSYTQIKFSVKNASI